MSKHKKASYIETIKSDTNADGHFDTFDTKTYTYDPHGKLTSEGSQYESALDGTKTYIITSYEYNKIGKPIRKVYQQDPDGDGDFDNDSTTVYRYNPDGILQEEITSLRIGPEMEIQTTRLSSLILIMIMMQLLVPIPVTTTMKNCYKMNIIPKSVNTMKKETL